MTRTRRLSIGQNLRFHITVAITRPQKARHLCFHFRWLEVSPSDVCTYKLLKRLTPDKPGIEVSTCTRSIDQCMKPAVEMLRQKFRCKQRMIRSQETEKLPPLLFPALVVDFFWLFEIRTVPRFIATELESIDSPIVLCEPCPTTTACK